jgi:hypothetical protein
VTIGKSVGRFDHAAAGERYDICQLLTPSRT